MHVSSGCMCASSVWSCSQTAGGMSQVLGWISGWTCVSYHTAVHNSCVVLGSRLLPTESLHRKVAVSAICLTSQVVRSGDGREASVVIVSPPPPPNHLLWLHDAHAEKLSKDPTLEEWLGTSNGLPSTSCPVHSICHVCPPTAEIYIEQSSHLACRQSKV